MEPTKHDETTETIFPHGADYHRDRTGNRY
jgi:hypothetical protein